MKDCEYCKNKEVEIFSHKFRWQNNFEANGECKSMTGIDHKNIYTNFCPNCGKQLKEFKENECNSCNKTEFIIKSKAIEKETKFKTEGIQFGKTSENIYINYCPTCGRQLSPCSFELEVHGNIEKIIGENK